MRSALRQSGRLENSWISTFGKHCEGVLSSIWFELGNPLTEILHASEELDSSLIIMTPHGKGILRELLGGSTSFEVERQATRPVLVLKMQKKGNDGTS
jgi:Universal stress protein UspA and related nucleotide-binding proteins